MLEEYPDKVSSPMKNLIQIVLESMPMDVQSIPLYLGSLLNSLILNTRDRPITVVECINPAAPYSQSATILGGSQERKVEQLHIPESNRLPAAGLYTLKSESSSSGSRHIDLPFIVRFTPDTMVNSQGPIELKVGMPDTIPVDSAIGKIPISGLGLSTSLQPTSYPFDVNPITVSPSNDHCTKPLKTPAVSSSDLTPSTSATPHSPATPPVTIPAPSEFTHIKFALGFPGAPPPPRLPEEMWEPLLDAELREMRAKFSLPESLKTEAQEEAEVACHIRFQDEVEMQRKFKEAEAEPLASPLRRENAFVGTLDLSQAEQLHSDAISTSEARHHDSPLSTRNDSGIGSGNNRLAEVERNLETQRDLSRSAGKKRGREDLGEDHDTEVVGKGGDDRPQKSKATGSREIDTVSAVRGVRPPHVENVGGSTASTAGSSTVRSTLRRSFRWTKALNFSSK
ncbi:hypothetical protein VNI00_013180 [Paramarasmius palmivorus]|uniref:Uncharacterized protein n=1 Tax=Paramarasmius palmivorus TaxID=297713 RepID=A0AAW0C2M4_9AGAR